MIRLIHDLKGHAFASGFDQVGALLDEFEGHAVRIQADAALKDMPQLDMLLAQNDQLLETVAQLRRGVA